MLPRLNLLISYAYLRDRTKQRGITLFEEMVLALSPYVDILIDSGAFTDYGQKKKALAAGKRHDGITVEEYIAACKRYHGRVWQYIMLDVIQNIEASRRNLAAMVGAGLKPMPVFIYPESYDEVPELVKINPHICVAGGVDAKRRFAQQRYQLTYKASGGEARIHGLGFVKHPDIFRLPLASVDSSSWCSGGRFGSISHYVPRTGFTTVNWREVKQDMHPRLWLHLQRCGIKPSDLSTVANHRQNFGIPAMTYAFAYLQLHQHCYSEGIRFFFAMPTTTWTQQLISIVAHTDTKANSFDYHAARATSIRARELAKRDPEAFTQWAVSVVKEKTAWQERLP